ncbi:MAG: P-II family nitrogen regulator [Gammaproteobacteria bacterium]|nr:P-II family nitrogen regulator [Gammaproteobacteria bacterium]MYD79283.1 P-II family nitrogen regulator [Gammaproteobacteria bacterium]
MLKLIIAFVSIDKSDEIIEAARKAGATGATVLNDVRGEGLKATKTFFGLDLTLVRTALLFVASESCSRNILNCISEICDFDDEPGSGIAIQLAIEDAVGLQSQLPYILESMDDDT